MGCSFINELVSGGKKIGVVWKSKDADNFFSWAFGDGSLQFGISPSVEIAKQDLIHASGESQL